MSEFDDIRPYNDSEVPAVVTRLIANPEFIDLLLSRRAPLLAKICPWALRPLLRLVLSKAAKNMHTVADLQRYLTGSLKGLVDKTTDGFSFSGVEKLDPTKSYLFLSNHRDIAMDPAMVNLALMESGMDTLRIAIGDNLLSKPFAADLMRVNRSFIVKRNISGRREKLTELKKLSGYIRHSIVQEGVSVWIAQREGRAKDGQDRTETALLKMLALSKDRDQSFAQAIGELSMVPVSISYEYDPCDVDKGRELFAKHNGQDYIKQEFEDLDTIQTGLVGYKGRLHVAFGDVLADASSDILESADKLAAAIDQQIYSHYKLFPSNIIAYQLLGKTAGLEQVKALWPDCDWADTQASFQSRLSAAPRDYRSIITESYAAPVDNYLKATQGC